MLASEGFATVDEIAYADLQEISSLEGLDEQTAQELQTRARDYLDKITAEQDQRRKDLGVADEVAEVDGVTLSMMVALGEADIKTVEDLAGCATDDLIGWTERKPGETIKHKGAFSELDVSAAEAEAVIMAARVKAGWIEKPEPAVEESAEQAGEEAQDA